MRPPIRHVTLAATMIGIDGCQGFQSSLDPAGEQAGRIAGLFSMYSWITLAVYLLVVVFLAWAAARARRQRHRLGGDERPIRFPNKDQERRMGVFVGGCVGVTVVILFVLLVGDFVTGKGLYS